MESHSAKSAILAVTVLALTAGCSQNPAPRSAANQGVSAPGVTRATHNANYYTGGDPDRPRTGKSGGGP
jgi:hypothetical protein